MCDIALLMTLAVYHTCISKVGFQCAERLECIFLHAVKKGKNMEFNFLKITFGKTTISFKTSTGRMVCDPTSSFA